MNAKTYGFHEMEYQERTPKAKKCYGYGEKSLVLVELLDGIGEGDSWHLELLSHFGCHFILLLWESQEEVKVLFLSNARKVRALEFLDFLIPEFGLVKGDAGCARGQVSSVILKVQMSGMELNEIIEYFMERTRAYFEDCDCIEAKDYAARHQQEILAWETYTKKRTAWAYVKSTDIVPAGSIICIKSLENESGVTVSVGEDTYIMIGCRGEIYHIERGKFESTYEISEEPLDIFGQMLDFMPAIETVPEGEYISLDELAHLCYPKKSAGIYSRQLKRRTKVFPADGQDYFLGREGDYLAVRRDDLRDIYIIQKDVFDQTYTKVYN